MPPIRPKHIVDTRYGLNNYIAADKIVELAADAKIVYSKYGSIRYKYPHTENGIAKLTIFIGTIHVDGHMIMHANFVWTRNLVLDLCNPDGQQFERAADLLKESIKQALHYWQSPESERKAMRIHYSNNLSAKNQNDRR